jgi:hypothetical protein
MHCRLCENLQRALEARRSEYIEASSDAYYRVSKRLAAYKNVEMERARAELQEHRMVCLAAMNASQSLLPSGMLRLSRPELLRRGSVKSAA